MNPERALCAAILYQAYEDANALATGRIPAHILALSDQRKMKARELLADLWAEVESLIDFARGEWFVDLCDGANMPSEKGRNLLFLSLTEAMLVDSVTVPRERYRARM